MTSFVQRCAVEGPALAPGTLAICDLHLDLVAREGGLAFAAWLDALDGVPLLIVLGDLFDVWVGPAQAAMPGAPPVLEALRGLVARGTRVLVVPGNRDFLLGPHFERASGAKLVSDGFVARLGDAVGAAGADAGREDEEHVDEEHARRRVLFVHGDELCTLDTGYQRLRAVVRSRPMLWLAPRVPLGLALRIARRLRRASARAVAHKPLERKSMQPASADALARACRADVLVCGHAHQHVEVQLEGGARWIVLDAFGGPRDLLRVAADGAIAVGSSAAPQHAAASAGPSTAADSEPDPRVDENPHGPTLSPRAPSAGRAAILSMIIAIDGPAAAGKSTAARRVAAQLGLDFLDTGAMYRAVTLVVLERGVDPNDAAGCAAIARDLDLAFDAQGRILIDGRPGEPAIRSEPVTRAVSAVSAHPSVRAAIVPLQRAAAERAVAAGGGIVAEGRDVGTVVFPRADHKFFLRASSEVRARRRAAEEGRPEAFEATLADVRRRDQLDATRADSPLACADDATVIGTDGLDADGVVAALLAEVRAGMRERGLP